MTCLYAPRFIASVPKVKVSYVAKILHGVSADFRGKYWIFYKQPKFWPAEPQIFKQLPRLESEILSNFPLSCQILLMWAHNRQKNVNNFIATFSLIFGTSDSNSRLNRKMELLIKKNVYDKVSHPDSKNQMCVVCRYFYWVEIVWKENEWKILSFFDWKWKIRRRSVRLKVAYVVWTRLLRAKMQPQIA